MQFMFCKYHQFKKKQWYTPQVTYDWSFIIVTKQLTVLKLDQQITQATSWVSYPVHHAHLWFRGQ